MNTLKGPGIFLAQFIDSTPPFNSLEGLAVWAANLGFKALQIPCNHKHIFDVEKAAASQQYCDENNNKKIPKNREIVLLRFKESMRYSALLPRDCNQLLREPC